MCLMHNWASNSGIPHHNNSHSERADGRQVVVSEFRISFEDTKKEDIMYAYFPLPET